MRNVIDGVLEHQLGVRAVWLWNNRGYAETDPERYREFEDSLLESLGAALEYHCLLLCSRDLKAQLAALTNAASGETKEPTE